jgi:hypothetical protein
MISILRRIKARRALVEKKHPGVFLGSVAFIGVVVVRSQGAVVVLLVHVKVQLKIGTDTFGDPFLCLPIPPHNCCHTPLDWPFVHDVSTRRGRCSSISSSFSCSFSSASYDEH